MDIADLLFQALIIILLLLGAFSFTLFIRRFLFNTEANKQASDEINKKLDKIIELLEKQAK